jgi:magnesium chelatase family protein
VPARRITVNLAPADLPKEGTGHDLAIAIAILVASNQLETDALRHTALIGELALDGSLRRVPGAMALVSAAGAAGVREVIVPAENGAESSAVRGMTVRAATSFAEVVRHLAGREGIAVLEPPPRSAEPAARDDAPDLAGVIGQHAARRALEIAVAGRHNIAFSGPPGVGKTLLARAAAGLLPPLDEDEAAEVSRIHSVAGVADADMPVSLRRPFRAPHHTISTQALVGGGARVRPGEASLAHRGALFLDETLQFRADALDALRGPIDSGTVHVARVDRVLALPASFMLLMAYNPCPCGWWAVEGRECSCEDGARRRYQARLSGPMRDRLDLIVHLEPVAVSIAGQAESTAQVAQRVRGAWEMQRARQGVANAALPVSALDATHGFDVALDGVLEARGRQMGLSLRRVHRATRVARTIADLEGCETVQVYHLDEALLHRPKALAA